MIERRRRLLFGSDSLPDISPTQRSLFRELVFNLHAFYQEITESGVFPPTGISLDPQLAIAVRWDIEKLRGKYGSVLKRLT